MAWFQNKPGGLPHYDLTAGKRDAAMRAGAIALTREQAVAKWRELRTDGHIWVEPTGVIPWPHCSVCLVIRRHDGRNKPCRGRASLDLR